MRWFQEIWNSLSIFNQFNFECKSIRRRWRRRILIFVFILYRSRPSRSTRNSMPQYEPHLLRRNEIWVKWRVYLHICTDIFQFTATTATITTLTRSMWRTKRNQQLNSIFISNYSCCQQSKKFQITAKQETIIGDDTTNRLNCNNCNITMMKVLYIDRWTSRITLVTSLEEDKFFGNVWCWDREPNFWWYRATTDATTRSRRSVKPNRSAGTRGTGLSTWNWWRRPVDWWASTT